MGFNFRGKFEKALKINFRGFKFRDSNQSRAWHCCTSDDVINTRSSRSFLLLSYTNRDLDK